MELKEFIKEVISDVTNAIKECQEELSNGAIISPTNSRAEEKIKSTSGDLKISYIDFEVAVTAVTSTGSNGETQKGVEVSGSVFGINVGGKLGGKSTNEENKQVNENASKIRFSIPLVYPTHKVKVRVTYAGTSLGTF